MNKNSNVKILAILKVNGYEDVWPYNIIDHYDVLVREEDSYAGYRVYSHTTELGELGMLPKSDYEDYYDYFERHHQDFKEYFWLKIPIAVEELTYQEIHNLRREIWGQLLIDPD